MNRYDYEELLGKALATNNADDINKLGEWCCIYGEDCWNGEYYDVSLPGETTGYRMLSPVYDNGANIIGYELF